MVPIAKRRSGKPTKSGKPGKSGWRSFNETRSLKRQQERNAAVSTKPRKRICGKTKPLTLEVQALRHFRKAEKIVDVKKVAVAVVDPELETLRWSFGFRCIQRKGTKDEDERVLVPAQWAPPLLYGSEAAPVLYDDPEAEFR